MEAHWCYWPTGIHGARGSSRGQWSTRTDWTHRTYWSLRGQWSTRTGTDGAQGPIGATGATGPARIPQYGYIYNTSAQVVPIEGDITFDADDNLTSGITHTPGSAQITVASAGKYKVAFSVSSVEPNQFTLCINGVPDTKMIYGSGAGTQQNNGQAIITLAAGDVLTLRNHISAAAVTLQTLAGGTQSVENASIIIEQLS